MIKAKKLVLLKKVTVKNVSFATIGFLIKGINLKIMFVIVVLIWQGFVLILGILLIPLLKVLIIVVLFTRLTNLKQLVSQKILCLMVVDIYKKN